MNSIFSNYYKIKTLASNELKVRYKRNIFGFFWSLLNPIFNIALISIVFSKIMNMPYKNFVMFLMPGIMAWNLFVNIINYCCNCITNNERIIKNIAIDKYIFPVVSSSIVLLDFILAMICMISLSIIFFYDHIYWAIIFLPISTLLLTVFALSIGMIISVINVYFRDVGHVVNILNQIMFFMTPILYDKARLGIYEELAGINPMLHFIDLFRDPIYKGIVPSYKTIIISLSWTISLFFIACFMYKKNNNNIVFRL